MFKNNLIVKSIILVLVIAALLVRWILSIDGSPITHDPISTLIMGINLAHNGVLSHLIEPPFLPTMYREPVPAIVSAFFVNGLDFMFGPVEISKYAWGEHAKFLKYQNILWALITTLSTLGLLYRITQSYWFSLLGAIAVNFNIPLINNVDINTLYSEPTSKAFLILSVFLLVSSIQKKSRRLLFIAGISFGVLALTKAIFLYVTLGLALIMPAVYLLFNPNSHRIFNSSDIKSSLLNSAIFMIAFILVVTPWISRNYHCCDQLSISERSGIIMMQRATLNEVTPIEYAGLFYRFSPPILSSAIGRLMGFDKDDFQKGGKLQRISFGLPTDFAEEDYLAEKNGQPEEAITYYRKARAMRTALVKTYEESGIVRPWSMADITLKHQALDQIKNNPGQHIAFILPALWRGSFIWAPMLLAVLYYAFIKKREDLALVILPALGMVILYAIFTPFLYRFGSTIMPIQIVLVLSIAHITWSKFKKRNQERGTILSIT